jgi:hypothetical protein
VRVVDHRRAAFGVDNLGVVFMRQRELARRWRFEMPFLFVPAGFVGPDPRLHVQPADLADLGLGQRVHGASAFLAARKQGHVGILFGRLTVSHQDRGLVEMDWRTITARGRRLRCVRPAAVRAAGKKQGTKNSDAIKRRCVYLLHRPSVVQLAETSLYDTTREWVDRN